MIVKVGPVTLRVSYHLVNTKIARTWTVYDLEAVKNFINNLMEKELLKEFYNL